MISKLCSPHNFKFHRNIKTPLKWKQVTSSYRLSTNVTPSTTSSSRKMSALEIQHLKRKGRKITMITAYDYPSAMHSSYADFDILLVGDSVGMVIYFCQVKFHIYYHIVCICIYL
jgi:hypothetical protein